jgi:broad specificity phosphatase PhoE
LALSDIGVEHARALAARLRDQDLRAVFCSPLTRAVATARLVADPHGLPPCPTPGLIDIDYGSWTGLSPEEARQRFPSEFEAWQKDPWSVRMPGGETLSAVKERSVPALEEIARQAGGTVAVISHDVVNRVLLTHVLQMPPSGFGRIRQEPACLNVLVNDAGTWQVIRLNDRCHLD